MPDDDTIDLVREVNGRPEAGTGVGSRPVRMRDVAELAGVGTMTVSRVLNGTARVTEETTDRVYRAIEQLQYRPNPLARALRGSPSHTIGVLLPYLYDPFFATCAHVINTVAQSHAYSVILTTTDEDPATELEEARQMLRRQIDGLILIPAQPGGSTLLQPEFRDLPIVTLDRPVPETDFDSVEVENKVAGVLGTEHLLGHGHTRICFLALSQGLYTMQTRHSGYETAMRRAGLEPEAYFNCQTQKLMTDLLRGLMASPAPPTALFTANGLTTRYALQALSQLQISVPRQMAMLGFDDFELADLVQPPLTVLRQPMLELGRAAAELLFERLEGGKTRGASRRIVLPVELVVRGSCGCHSPGTAESRTDAGWVLAPKVSGARVKTGRNR